MTGSCSVKNGVMVQRLRGQSKKWSGDNVCMG